MKTPHDARIAAICAAIDALSILSQQDAIDIVRAMVPKFPHGAEESLYLLDCIGQIEDDIAAEAEDDSEYALADEPAGLRAEYESQRDDLPAHADPRNWDYWSKYL